MDIPGTQMGASSNLLEDLAGVQTDTETISVYGRAKRFERLRELSKIRILWISGLAEKRTEILPEMSTLERLTIHDYRCTSLASLPKMTALQSLVICGSAKLRSLEGLQRYSQLTELILFDTCNYSGLTPLEALTKLETLCLEGGFSKPLRVQTFRPLIGLTKLRRLRLASIRVEDRSLEPLRSLKRLESVFIAKAFPNDEFEALAQALPKARGQFLDNYRY